MNELQIIINQNLGIISTNFDEIEINLKEQMQIYKELEVTEANKPERKKDIAVLRKYIKAINERSSEVKEEFMKPYDDFKKAANSLIEIINEPIRILDNQVKEFEKRQRIKKKEEIKSIFELLLLNYPELVENIGLAEIYESRWENATTPIKSIKEDVAIRLEKIRSEVALINSMISEKTKEALSLYWGDLDVTKAVAMINRHEAQKREIQARLEEQQRKEKEAELDRERERIREEERRRIREEEAIREEERRKAAAEEDRIREEERLATEKRLMSAKTADPAMVNMETMTTYKIIGTDEELHMIEMYMNSIGVEFIKGDF